MIACGLFDVIGVQILLAGCHIFYYSLGELIMRKDNFFWLIDHAVCYFSFEAFLSLR